MAKGVIAVPCAEQGRWSAVWGCLADLERPPDTVVRQVRGANPARSRNMLAREAIEQGAEWIFFVDDDLILPRLTLTHLLAHDALIVCALSLRRVPPFEALWVEGEWPDVRWVVDPGDTPRFIAGCTSGGLLVKTEVFARISEPWWAVGKFEPDIGTGTEDLWFCQQITNAGIPIIGDPQVKVGHMTNVEVWPAPVGTLLARGDKPWCVLPRA